MSKRKQNECAEEVDVASSLAGVSSDGGERSSGENGGASPSPSESQENNNSSKVSTADGTELGSPSPTKKRKGPPRALKAGEMPKTLPLFFRPKMKNVREDLIIQVDGSEMDIGGDSGAIGRFHADSGGIQLDLKGQRYHGDVFRGPTILTIGITAEAATVENATDMFCHARHERDVMGALKGKVTKGSVDTSELFTGDIDVNSAEQRRLDRGQQVLSNTFGPSSSKKSKKKKKKRRR